MATQAEDLRGVHASASSTRQLLQYRKLSVDPSRPEIRLLEVRPAQGIHETVSARIVNLPLTPDLDFIGVSALYGDTDDTEPIIIDGRRVAVPANLGQALRHARAVFWPAATTPQAHAQAQAGPVSAAAAAAEDSRGGTTGVLEPARKKPHWLRQLLRSLVLPSADGERLSRGGGGGQTLRVWIDAFCVDERDARERKEQHTLMATAYRHARTVVGWLGPKDETSDLAVQVIRDVDRAVPAGFGSPGDREAHPEHYAPRHTWVGGIQHLWRVPEGVADLRRSDTWVAMSRFLGRPYFQREWILSEIAMATFPTFLVGTDVVSWSEVLRWNLCNEELSDKGSAQFPEEYRTDIVSFLPLGTVYTMLKAFERSRDSRAPDLTPRSTLTRSLSTYN